MSTKNLTKELAALRAAIDETPAGERRVYLEALERRMENRTKQFCLRCSEIDEAILNLRRVLRTWS